MVSSISLARDKVITAGTSMGNESSVVAVAIEDDAVSAGRAAGINFVAVQDWKFVPGTRSVEIETLVVIVLVGV